VPAQHHGLAPLERGEVEARDQLAEQPVPVDLRLEVQEHRRQADRGAVHDHELARDVDAARPVQLGDDALGGVAAVDLAGEGAEGAAPVLEQRLEQEARPDVERIDHRSGQVPEAPGPIGVHGQLLVTVAHRAVEIDHALHQGRREDPQAAEVEQVEAAVGPDRVVAEMGVAVDHAVAEERHVPGAEHGDGEIGALPRRSLARAEDRLALQPGHGQQPPRAQLRDRLRHGDRGLLAEQVAVEPHVTRLPGVVELLPQTLLELGADVAHEQRALIALEDAQDHLELAEIGLDGAFHARILQLAGERPAVEAHRPVDLAERGRGGGVALERGEAALPVGPQLARHAAADEAPAHRRRLGLQHDQLGDVLGRERPGHGGEQLGHLDHGTAQAAERVLELARQLAGIVPHPEIALAGEARDEAAHGPGDAGVAGEPARQGAAVVAGPGWRSGRHAPSPWLSLGPWRGP
jgi:hypothetical protein